MPSSSKKQHNFMAAVAHNKGFAKKVGVQQSVGKDFTEADKGKKFMNPRARKFGGKVKGYSGADGESQVEPKESLGSRVASGIKNFAGKVANKGKSYKDTEEPVELDEVNVTPPEEDTPVASRGMGAEAEEREKLNRPTPAPPSKAKPEAKPKAKPNAKPNAKPKESLADKNSKMLSQMLKKHVKEHPEPYPTKAEADILREQEYKKMDKQTNEGYENYKKRRQSGEMSEYKKGGSVKSRVDGCAQRGKTRGSYR